MVSPLSSQLLVIVNVSRDKHFDRLLDLEILFRAKYTWFVCLQMCFGGMGSHECHRNPIKNISYISVFLNEKPDSALHSSPFPQMVSVTARVTIAAETSLLLPQCLSQEQAQAIQRARRRWYLYIETIPLSLFPTCL